MDAFDQLATFMFLFIFIGVGCGFAEMAFQHYMSQGQILEPYRRFLLKYMRYYHICKRYGRKRNVYAYWFGYITRPLGMCPYCNGVWLTLIIFTWFYYVLIGTWILFIPTFLVTNGISFIVIKHIDEYKM